MSKLFTLTVPDVLWINLQLTGKPQSFDYATLEEATFYQFASGNSKDIARQAARFLVGFRRLAPLAVGNDATAFVSTVAFLRMNNSNLDISDELAAGWLEQVWANTTDATLVTGKVKEDHSHHSGLVPPSEDIVSEVIAEYPKTLSALKAALAAQSN